MQPCTPVSKPNVWRVDPDHLTVEHINSAASVIRGGGVVVFPTETFYGLGGDPFSEQAIERIYLIKGRDFSKPLPLIAAGMTPVRQAILDWPPVADQLAKAFWPGPLTLILSASPALPSSLHAHTGKIAIRISPHPVAQALSHAAGGLLISTSANPGGQPAHINPDHMAPSFLEQVDGVLDAGPTPGHLPSTIVDVSIFPPRLVRAGALSWDIIEAAVRLSFNRYSINPSFE